MHGSVEGVLGDWHSYSDSQLDGEESENSSELIDARRWASISLSTSA
jgi:hypothetical protein